MRKLFLCVMLAGILTAPTVMAEAAETQEVTVVTEKRTDRGKDDQERTEERLLREAKRIVREIFKAQREAKKTERAETTVKIEELRGKLEEADRETKKELRAAIEELRKNKKFDLVDVFLDNLVLQYGKEKTAKSEGYVVVVDDTRKNLDAVVEYDNTSRTLTVTKGDIIVTVTVDANGAYVNGEVLFTCGKKEDMTEEAE